MKIQYKLWKREESGREVHREEKVELAHPTNTTLYQHTSQIVVLHMAT